MAAPDPGPWSPPKDEELTWFRDGKLLPTPRPLEYTLEVYALVFGLTYALESLEFPLYALRSRLHNGRLYLAVVPSAMAERNLSHRMQSIRDQSFRFTRNVYGAWERQVKPEVEGYNRWFEETASFRGPVSEFAERFCKLRRVRGDQWYATIRGVVAPTAMLHAGIVDSPSDAVVKAETALGEALEVVKERGGTLVYQVLGDVGKRLASNGSIAKAEDIVWLEWRELQKDLEGGNDRVGLVAARKAENENLLRSGTPGQMGPELPLTVPRMYLVREVLDLLTATKP
ncbi:MAG: hypothetical protein WCH75_09125 [Candidatus Binatia bacterium]